LAFDCYRKLVGEASDPRCIEQSRQIRRLDTLPLDEVAEFEHVPELLRDEPPGMTEQVQAQGREDARFHSSRQLLTGFLGIRGRQIEADLRVERLVQLEC
jgi:hypothetical protein